MLATQSMSSYPGQQNSFPFGYNPDSIHGVGLPDFMTPGPPPGQPLLNDNERIDLSSFFTEFESGDISVKSASRSHFHDSGQMNHGYDLPPTFVGSESSYGVRSGVDPHQLQMGGFNIFGNGMVPGPMAHMNPENTFENGMHNNNGIQEPSYPNPLLNQMHAANSMPQPYGQHWPQNYPPQNMVPQIMPTGRPMVRFGSDSHFQPSHYIPPNGQMEPEMMQSLDWIEAQSSATTTQPNTQPNTQPSSPYQAKKRKFDDFVPGNGFPIGIPNGHPTGLQSGPTSPVVLKTAQKRRKSLKQEQPPTPNSTTRPTFHGTLDDHDDDPDDQDDQAPSPSRSPSPATPWPKNKPRPAKATKHSPTSKSKKGSKKPTRHAKPERIPSSSARTPLTAEQKKANHTNSEQRRRDATARAYAELYDLVPELENLGKQSTMKKLEVVVASLKKLKEGNVTLRGMLG